MLDLLKTNKKFIRRFKSIEQKAKKLNKSIHEMNLQEMETLWQEAKKEKL